VAPVAVPATLLDLAARGYLRIEEHPVQGSRRRVWHVVRLPQPEHDLRAYERVLLVQLFGRRTLRRLPDLHRRFRDRFDRVRGALEEEAVQLGWFTAEPGQVQATWARRGAALVVIGAVLLGLAVWRARLALVPIPIIVAGLVVWWGGRWLPRRTPTGTALARRVAGFRSYLQTPWTDPRGAAAAERVFSEELPYVVVFGRTRRWVQGPSPARRQRRALLLVPERPAAPVELAGRPDRPDRAVVGQASHGPARQQRLASPCTHRHERLDLGQPPLLERWLLGRRRIGQRGRRWWRWRLLVTLAAEPAWWRPSCSRWW
jgi:uncharacterized protein (TIGR04222 family)